MAFDHFLKSFMYSKEPFAIMGGRLYTLSKTNGSFNGGDAFHFIDKAYALHESEEISQLESFFFSQNRRNIERSMSDYIKVNFKDKMKSTQAALKRMQNIYSSMQDNTIDKFIMVDVFNHYNHENRVDNDNTVNTADWDKVDYDDAPPGVNDLMSNQNSVDQLIGKEGVIVIGNKCYSIFQNGGKQDKREGYVMFRNKVLNIRPDVPLEKLCSNYSHKLQERIIQKSNEHASEFAEILGKMNKEKSQLDQGIKRRREISGKTSDQRGEIGYRKIKDGEYEVSVTVKPYIIEKAGEYHAFGSVKLGVILRSRGNQVMIDDAPRVLSMPYVHPFVWDDSNICFGNLNWSSQRNVRFNHWYNLTGENAAKRVAETMREGKRTMESGYVGSEFTPVRAIENCNAYIGDNRAAAEQYARTHGMKKERIIKNA